MRAGEKTEGAKDNSNLKLVSNVRSVNCAMN